MGEDGNYLEPLIEDLMGFKSVCVCVCARAVRLRVHECTHAWCISLNILLSLQQRLEMKSFAKRQKDKLG